MCDILCKKEKNMDKYQEKLERLENEFQELANSLERLIQEYKSSLIQKNLEKQEGAPRLYQFALHLPVVLRQAINKNKFESAEVQEMLSYMQGAIQAGKISVMPKRYAQDAIDAGIKIRPEDHFVHMANGEKNLHEVSQNLLNIHLKHLRLARQAQKSARENPVKNKTLQQTLVVGFPEKIKEALEAQDFSSPEVQAYLNYIYKAVQQGDITIGHNVLNKQLRQQGIQLPNSTKFFYIAKDGLTLQKITSDLGQIRKKYKQSLKPKRNNKVFVILLPNKIKNAFKERDFENPEVQEYLKYLLCAREKGLLITVDRNNKEELKKHNIKLVDNSDLFFVAKGPEAYAQISHELHEIRKKYEHLQKAIMIAPQPCPKIVSKSGSREDFYPFTKYEWVCEPAKEKPIAQNQTQPQKLSRKKSLKMNQKNICVGNDGTIFYPFN